MFTRTLVFITLALSAIAAPALNDVPPVPTTVTVTITAPCDVPTDAATLAPSVTTDLPTSVALPTDLTSAIPSTTPIPTSIAPALAAPEPTPGADQVQANAAPTCSNGPVQCCNQVMPADQVNWSSILPTNLLANIPAGIQGLQTPVGLNCIPIGIEGGAGNSCATQTTCCENNNFQGLVAIGCSPINVGL